ncbi:MAG: low molecular weight phosphotyrosine protein phosphatase [Lachnospiraceae bacterium]|nr:low molecular weight phosphotyrosine protein phosphatase [Lachnospiraceae bacterium]
MQGKIKILFICHGNICRSPMAEFLLKDMVSRQGIADQFVIASAATSREEIGNPVHYGTRRKLREYGISTEGKYAVQLTKKDYERYDYLIGMDSYNIRNMERILGHTGGKICKLLEFAGSDADVADPWYTGDFDRTYMDIKKGCEALLERLRREGKIQ